MQPETFPLETVRGERWISISGVDFFGGIVYAFRDVTDARRLEELKADFVATASHELRTPLAAVYGAAQTLRRHDFALDEAGRNRFVSLIVDESERLNRIVNEILLANQLDAGRLDLVDEPFDADDLVHRVVESAREHGPPGIRFETLVADSTPPVAADRDRVRQVLVNLVENAIKYSPDGGFIKVGVQPAESSVCFYVRDQGLGIPADEQARIFEKFYRLDPEMTRGIGGTGLGLYICSELLERMDGRIWVESTEGVGSTFSFELPAAEPAAARPAAVGEPRDLIGRPAPARPGRASRDQLAPPLEPAELVELPLGRRLGPGQWLAHAQRPARRLQHLLDLDARVERHELELAVAPGLEDAQVGDDGEGVAAAPERGDEVEALDEGPRRMPEQDDDLPGGRGDLGRPARTRQADLGMVVGADHRRVDVPAPVDLGRAEKADVHAPGADPVAEHLGHRHELVGGGGEVVVADGEGQVDRLRADRPGLVDEHAVGRVQPSGQVRGRVRRADPDQADLAVLQGPRGLDRHDLLGRRRVHPRSRTCSCIQAEKRSRSREISSHSE